MLKLENGSLEKGTRIVIPETWHEKLLSFTQNEYVLTDIVRLNKETYYVCEEDKQKVKIALTESVAKYLFAKEVPDSNNVFGFKEYLPLEDTYVLVKNNKSTKVIPAVMRLKLQSVKIYEESVSTFYFKLVSYYKSSNIREYSDWKLLFSTRNMTNGCRLKEGSVAKY